MIQSKSIVYHLDDHTFEGILCWDDTHQSERPGVLVSHQWMGQGDFEVEKAKDLAAMGYVAFAIDNYGQGRRATNPEEATALMGECMVDRAMLRDRLFNAMDVLKAQDFVDADRIGGIGFCFGGKCMLDMARAGAAMRGVVSFHGIYDQPGLDYNEPIKTSILVLHGWDDPLATPEQTVTLGKELTERQADWQILAFGHTGHAFTNPHAAAPENGMFYQKASNQRAWQAMTNFFEERFAS